MQTKDDEIAELARTVAGLQSALDDERGSPVATAGAPRAVAASEPSRRRGERPPLGAARLIVTFFR